MARRSWTPRRRLSLFEVHKGICHICAEKINGTKEPWDIEHIIPIAMGGADEESNCAPAHVKCHKAKTKTDKGQIAKANRVRAKHNGAYRTKAKIPGSKGTGVRKKMNGDVIRVKE